MACGTPVIAFDRGSMPELIENGKNGFLVDNVDRGH
jgi:glycosyltransferase involved in cell wall biosynthesis